MSEDQIQEIPLSLIDAGNNDRKKFRAEELLALGEDIRANGLHQAITLRPVGGRFEIVAGERRFRASELAGLPTIRAVVRVIGDELASKIMLSENTNRVQLTPVEEARAFAKRLGEGWSQADCAKVAGLSQETVKKRLGLLSLSDTVIRLIDIGDFPLGHAECMIRLDPQRQQMAFGIYVRAEKGLSYAAFKDIADKLQNEQDQGALFELESFFLQSVQVAKRPSVIAYGRVSTAEQGLTGHGLDAQRTALEAECKRRDWAMTWIGDVASGKSMDRPGLQLALGELKRRKHVALIVCKLDRVSRSVSDFADLLDRSRREKWSLVIQDLNIDTTTPNGEFIANLMAGLAQWERRIIGQRTKEGLAEAARKGVRLGAERKCPPETRDLIALRANAGDNPRQIADYLNLQGVSSPGGGSWHRTSVMRELRRIK